MFEPSELEKGMLTSKDNEIRTADVPERFQVRYEIVKKNILKYKSPRRAKLQI